MQAASTTASVGDGALGIFRDIMNVKIDSTRTP